MNEQDEVIEERPRKRINPWLIVAIIAAIAAGVLLASSVWTGRFGGASEAPENSVEAKKAQDPQAWCAAQSTYDAMKRELFRRAAQVRGSDDQAYAKLADFALLRVNGPIVRGLDDQLQSVSCSGTALLDLPPGVAVAGGRRALSGDVDYSIQPAADGSGRVVSLGNADSIVVPLATLSRTSAPQTPVPALPQGNAVGPEQPAAQQPPAQQPQPQPEPVQANPSFDCDHVGNDAEAAICGDPGLASLDRQMAADFQRALMTADKHQRRLLERTQKRFLGYRNRCATNQCIAETYQSRSREIGDIMTGRWRG
ncbi:MAG: lysozyme inhibitor LprI family protein [Sphingomicrobium sp.]